MVDSSLESTQLNNSAPTFSADQFVQNIRSNIMYPRVQTIELALRT